MEEERSFQYERDERIVAIVTIVAFVVLTPCYFLLCAYCSTL